MKTLISNLAKEGIYPSTSNEDEIKFNEGYESYEFYKALLDSVKERLYVFGRKNRKLFTKNNTKIKKLIDAGIDFKCLFLSEKSDERILNMAQENDNFKKDLTKVIEGVKQRYKDNLEHFRKYDFQQIKRIMIVDDAVIFVPVEFENSKVKHFTKSSFSIIPLESKKGMDLELEFKKVWDSSKEI